MDTKLNYRRTTGAMVVLLFLLFTCPTTKGQVNFLPNGGFEQVSGALEGHNQIHRANGWTDLNVGCLGGTADLFSATATHTGMSLPDNLFGSYQAEGNCAGITAYYHEPLFPQCTDERNLPHTNFIEPLRAGQTYTVTLTAMLAQRSCYTSKIGVMLHEQAYPTAPFEGQYTELVVPSEGAHTITFEVTPERDMAGLSIGNHKTYAESEVGVRFLPDSVQAGEAGVGYNPQGLRHAYYYIDNVKVTKGEAPQSQPVNPLVFEIQGQNIHHTQGQTLTMFDMAGRKLAQGKEIEAPHGVAVIIRDEQGNFLKKFLN